MLHISQLKYRISLSIDWTSEDDFIEAGKSVLVFVISCSRGQSGQSVRRLRRKLTISMSK